MSFIRKSVVKGHTYYQRCESYRENGKVKTRVLEHLGKNHPDDIPKPTMEVGKLREKQEMLEAEISRLKAENQRMKKQLRRHNLESFPPTYQGALSYIEAIATSDVYPEPERIANDLDRLGFPAFKDGKWTKDKVKRQLEKFRVSKVKTLDAQVVL